jgi:hypothetical protein
LGVKTIQLASDRTSCRSPLANQFRLILHAAAYWLLLKLREAIPDIISTATRSPPDCPEPSHKLVTMSRHCSANRLNCNARSLGKSMQPRMMSAAACLACFLALLSPPASAQQDAAALSGVIVQLIPPLKMGEALIAACAARQPERKANHATAFDAWRRANAVEAVETLLNDLAVRAPAIAAVRAKIEGSAQTAASALFAADTAVCDKLPAVFGSPAFAIRDRVAQAQKLAQTLAPAGTLPAASPAPEIRFYTLAQASSLALAAMDRAGSFEQGRDKSDILDARERMASAALKALGAFAAGGRVVKEDEFQEWRGDQQAVFSAQCHSFADPEAKTQMAALMNQEIIVIGEASSAYQTRAGLSGVILERCRLAASPGALPKAQAPETNGLKLRPPTIAEASAKPRGGFGAGQIAGIVFASRFKSRMDGFGNGYVRRQEHTYLLLSDGTAYEHHWPFPFADLNVETVRRRDSGFWLRWEKSGGKLVIAHIEGADAGRREELAKYDTLEPLPSDARLTGSYIFEDIGVGGAQVRRGYDFRADGTLELTRSSFAAGKTDGGGFFSAVGPSGNATARYRIDGYALELTNSQNATERHVIAAFGSEGSGAPLKTLYLDGQTLWSKDP